MAVDKTMNQLKHDDDVGDGHSKRSLSMVKHVFATLVVILKVFVGVCVGSHGRRQLGTCLRCRLRGDLAHKWAKQVPPYAGDCSPYVGGFKLKFVHAFRRLVNFRYGAAARIFIPQVSPYRHKLENYHPDVGAPL